MQESNMICLCRKETCHDESFEVAKYFSRILYDKLSKAITEGADVDRRLKAYSLFIQSLDLKYQRISASGTSAGGQVGNADRQTGGSSSEVWHQEEENRYVFDSPKELENSLDIQQGKTGLQGSCGICSVENVVRISGRGATEDTVYQCAAQNGFCGREGGTTPQSRQRLLAAHGIASTLEEQNLDNIAVTIHQGKGVILSVDATKLYHMGGFRRRLHAVTATSVTVNENGEVTEVTICDSNALHRGQSGAHNYSAQELKRALTKRLMNVTERIR